MLALGSTLPPLSGPVVMLEAFEVFRYIRRQSSPNNLHGYALRVVEAVVGALPDNVPPALFQFPSRSLQLQLLPIWAVHHPPFFHRVCLLVTTIRLKVRRLCLT